MTNIIIPCAGNGTRLMPYTINKPKPMVCVQGKTIIGHILDKLYEIEHNKIILIVGYKKEKLIEYINKYYSHLNIEFVEQRKRLGVPNAIYEARRYIKDDSLIVLSDIILPSYKVIHKNNTIFVGYTDQPQNYGIVEVNDQYITNFEEKPENPKSNLVMVGIYYFKDIKFLEYVNEIGQKEDKEHSFTEVLQKMGEFKYQMTEWKDYGTCELFLKNYNK